MRRTNPKIAGASDFRANESNMRSPQDWSMLIITSLTLGQVQSMTVGAVVPRFSWQVLESEAFCIIGKPTN